MAQYVAITRSGEHWEYICAGADPQEVYLSALDILQGRSYGSIEDGETGEVFLAPHTERRMDNLRVVPETIAEEVYHAAFPRARLEEV